MPELPETDIRVRETLTGLIARLRFIAQKEGLNGQSLLDMQAEVERTRFNFKSEHGYDFPQVAPFVLPSSGVIVFYRRDLNNREIQDKIRYLLRELGKNKVPVLTMELVKAVTFVWPHYKPDAIREDKKIAYIN